MRPIDRRELARIERAVTGILSGSALAGTLDRVRGDVPRRAYYDRATEVMRALEGRMVASSEVDAVEHWLAAKGAFAATTEARPLARLWVVLLACAAAAVLAFGLRPPERADPGERLTAKGAGRNRPLAIEALCARASGELVDANGGTCDVAGTLTFAAWLDGRFVGGDQLIVFGIDEAGELLYYVPTPDGRPAPRLDRNRWQPLGRAVRLAVNHGQGAVRVYAAVTPRPVTIEEIDATAAAIDASIASPGDPDWIERLAGRGPIAAICTGDRECAAAEFVFYVTGDAR